MNKISSLLALLIISQISNSQNTILWKVTDSLNNKTSFIVGTFHQFGNSFVDSIPEIKEFLIKSELAVFESIDKIESTRKMIDQREPSLEIKKKLKKKDLKKLKEISKDWEVDLYKLKPIEIHFKLQQEFQKIRCETVKPTDIFDHFDKYLQHIAVKNNIEILGLETDKLQLSLIIRQNKNANWKKEREKISYWINQMTTNKPNMDSCSFANKYRKFDIQYEFEKECKKDVLILQRNNQWMETIPNLLSSKNTFIAVGYFHLKNKCGILEQLKNKGFKVEPIEVNQLQLINHSTTMD